MFRHSVPTTKRSYAFAWAVVLAGAISTLPTASFAQASPERLSDKEVKTIIEDLDTARDKFEGNLDNDVKRAIIRTPTREVAASAVLQDLQDNTKKLKERFTSDYAASAEVETVLQHATGIANYMKTGASGAKGRSEWEKLSADLTVLAGAYGTTFPLPIGATVRRMNDNEAGAAADALAKAADEFKDKVDEHDGKLSPADEATGKKTADDLAKAAKTLRSRVSDGKPATAEAKQVVQFASALSAFNVAHPVPAAQASWASVQTSLAKIEQAFRMVPTPMR
jgi:hypothetical protein